MKHKDRYPSETKALDIAVIYGASDDLIYVACGNHCEEFHPEGESAVIAFSEGTMLNVTYDDNGIWRIAKVFGGESTMTKEEGDVGEDTFDVVTLSLANGNTFRWALMSTGSRDCVMAIKTPAII